MSVTYRVLHVDDKPDFTALTAERLEQEDDRFQVETAASVAEGFEILDQGDVDCVVSDYEMPGTNGIEFLEDVRAEHPDLPFILFTGKGTEAVASRAVSAGVTDYLQKEGGVDQFTVLANRIENAVGKYRTEQELAVTRRQYEKVAEQNLAGIYLIQNDEFVYVNPKLAEIHGYDREVMVGMSPLDLIVPEERERIRENLRRRLSGEVEDAQYETTGLTKDGDRIDIELHGSRITYDGGPAIIGTVLDITERKKQKRTLEQQRQRLTVALEGANAGVWEWIPATDEVIWHESTERLFGLEPGTFEGTYDAFAERVNDEDIHTLETAINEARPSQDSFEAEVRIHTADDAQLWAYSRGEFVDVEGLSSRYIGVITDITERKQREQDLEQTKERYRTLLDAAPDAIFVADAESGEIRATNQAATQLLDRPREEIVGMHQTELHPPERVEEYVELFEEHVTSGAGRDEALGEQVDVYVRDANGNEVPVEINARTVEIDDEHLIQGYFRDITERKQRERELRRQNERLDEFTSVVSHDLKNPLNTLSLSLDLVETDDEEPLERCRQAVDRMERLIDDLLTLARHGETSAGETPVTLEDVARQCWQTTAPPETTLTVETDAQIVAEKPLLKQLFENLFSNAIDHGGEAVSVTVGHTDDGFYVEDDGVGIPEAQREKSFELGYSTNEAGTGFGLAIVEQIAESHGWDVRVTEGADGGARFEFTDVEGLDQGPDGHSTSP